MANEVKVRTTAPGAKQATGEVHGLRDAYDRLQKQGAKGLGIGIGAGVAVAGLNLVEGAVAGVGNVLFDSIAAASDLNETMSKSHVVFGNAAGGVEAFGKKAASSFGMSKQAAIEAAASFGNVFTGVGLTQAKAAEMSTSLVGLAGDLASFNNLDPTVALEKLRSGLAGEAEPLRSVGVFLTEAQVKAKGMQLGLAGAHGELSEGAKILARYQLILEQTKTAQGDFARTSDGLANRQRELNAKLKDTEAELGQRLIPISLEANRVVLLALDKYAQGLDDVQKAAANGSQAAQRQLNLLAAVAKDAGITIEQAWQFAADGVGMNAGAMRKAFEATTNASITAGLAFHHLSDSSDELTAAMGKGGPKAAYLGGQLIHLTTNAKDTHTAIDGLTTSIETGLFGRAINAGNEAQLKITIKDLIEQRKAVKRGSLEYIQLTGEIAKNREELFNLHLTQAATAGPKAAVAFLRQQIALYGDASGAIQVLINKYQHLYDLERHTRIDTIAHGGGGAGGDFGHHARGGHIAAGEPGIVGEEGPELFVPDTAGTVVPNGAASGGVAVSAAPMVIAVPMMWSPAVQQQFIRDAGPAIKDYLRRSGLV